MKTLLAIITITALAPTLVFPLNVETEARRGHGHDPDYIEAVMATASINLSDNQIKKLNALRENHLQEIEPIQLQLYGKNDELRFLWLERKPDQEKIQTIQKEVQLLRSKRNAKRRSYRLEVQKILTSEQQARTKGCERRYRYGPRMNNEHPMNNGQITGLRKGY